MLSHAIEIPSRNASLCKIILEMNDSEQGSMNVYCTFEENDLQMGVFTKLHRKGMSVNTVPQTYLDRSKRIS